MKLKYPARIQMAHLPTPMDRLNRLSRYLNGPELLIKRDDQTGLALGGNKTRKLEFLVADALEKRCSHLITTGSPQSNHCRQTAAAAAHFNLGCSLVLRGEWLGETKGNLLLDQLLGAQLFWAGDRAPDEVMHEVADEVQAAGQKPYIIPLGGSNVYGATSYVLAMEELMSQLEADHLKVDCIILASSSGGTQAGLALGADAFRFGGRILGISIEYPASKLRALVGELVTATGAHLGLSPSEPPITIEVSDDYLGEGYGIVGKAEREAIRLVAQLEGILLDPVYTGRAMVGLIDLIRQGVFSPGQRLLFWHTGGTPALFAYADKLL